MQSFPLAPSTTRHHGETKTTRQTRSQVVKNWNQIDSTRQTTLTVRFLSLRSPPVPCCLRLDRPDTRQSTNFWTNRISSSFGCHQLSSCPGCRSSRIWHVTVKRRKFCLQERPCQKETLPGYRIWDGSARPASHRYYRMLEVFMEPHIFGNTFDVRKTGGCCAKLIAGLNVNVWSSPPLPPSFLPSPGPQRTWSETAWTCITPHYTGLGPDGDPSKTSTKKRRRNGMQIVWE